MPGEHGTGHSIRYSFDPDALHVYPRGRVWNRSIPSPLQVWGLLKKAESLRFEALEAHGGRSVGTLVTVLQRIMTDGGGLAGKSNRSAV